MARINVKNPVANRALCTPSRPALTMGKICTPSRPALTMGKIRMKIPVGNRTQRPIERLDNARDTAAMLQLNNFVAQGGSQPANFIPPLDGETFVEERTDTFDIVEEFNPLPGLEDDEEDDSDDECGEWVTLVEEEPDKIDIMVSASNERHVQRAKEFNWTRLLDQLHPVHMCQKLLTKNWTRVNWNETFNTRCNCPAGVKTSSMIDLVDLHAQDHIRLRFCGCTPDAIRLLRCGNLAGSPVVPQTAFSLPLLIFHNSLLHAKKRQHARDMRRPFTAAVDMYRQLERISESVVFSGLGLQPQQILANLTCPACFGPQPLNTSAYPETTCNRLIFRATESEVRDLVNVIEAESEALKEDIANLSGEDMPAGGELFVQAVHLRAERQPVLDTKTGLRLGTNLKEKIFKAQNDRKPAVMKMITEYNVQYSEYKLKYPNQLGSDVGENDLLSYKRLSTMLLDDAFWNDRLFYHSDAPWAINANIRQGVSSMKRGDDEVPRDHFDEIDLFNVSRRDKANHCQPQANPDFLATWRDVPKNLPPDKYSISGDQANNNDDNWEEEILAAVVEDGEDADVVASDVEDEGHD
ncbi:hypothetical protein MJO29_010172 [Puccinia striiformis f. sp. tritici]|nr:hypothetical protein MJO29_010172 [Puccinia striiformis f. sp. tritici]